jgi:DNA-binding NarL/FixJ family response regulator
VKLVLADHEHLVRHGLKCFLEQSGHAVVAEADDARRLLPAVARHKPSAVIIDFELPPFGAPHVLSTLRRRSPATPVVVLCRVVSETFLVHSLRNGAAAHVAKAAHPDELHKALEAAAAGERFVSRPFSRRPLEHWLKRAERGIADAYESLGVREREVLHLIAQGLSSTAIGRRLGISARTVETHRERIKAKLGVSSHAGLIRYAVERELMGLALVRRQRQDTGPS